MNTDHKASADSALARWGHDPHALVQVLRETQALTHWLSRDLLAHIAQALRLPLAQVEGVATFYRFFHTQPVGRVRVLFSDNITDRMLGSEALLARLCERLGVSPGETDAQGRFSVDRASCTGLCDQGPALLINHHQVITRLDAARVDALAALMLSEVPLDHWPADWFHVHNTVHRADALLTGLPVDAPALSAVIAREPQALIDELARAGLRGRGGAGFPTARKWHACRDASGPLRCVVCNADEGEPGTFKDRALLSEHADAVFDGMTIAARAIGAQQGWLYLRGEYRYLLPHLQKVLERRRARGLLGPNATGLAGFHFDIGIHLGAGAYVCGEESALIESLEGKRGVPRSRPPFPVTHGYKQQPTAVDNVETFCSAALVMQMGAENFRAIGTAKSSGSKLISVSGDCPRPGIYEYPFGVLVRQVLQDCGAVNTRAVQISGPSGVCVAESEFDRKLCFEDLPTAGAFMVFDDSRDLFEVARNFVHFFAHESCGFCTPCRVGTAMLKQTMDKIAAGHGTQHDLREVENLDHVLQTTSHCGLGRSACNPVLHTLKHFRPAYESRLKSLDFEPGFDLDGALDRARQMTGRDDAGAHLRTEET